MSNRNIIVLLSAALFGTAAFAATGAAQLEAQVAGSEAPKMVAESIHTARVHGIDTTARQPEAQAPGDAAAQDIAEQLHLKLQHGQVNDAADRRMLRDASRL